LQKSGFAQSYQYYSGLRAFGLKTCPKGVGQDEFIRGRKF